MHLSNERHSFSIAVQLNFWDHTNDMLKRQLRFNGRYLNFTWKVKMTCVFSLIAAAQINLIANFEAGKAIRLKLSSYSSRRMFQTNRISSNKFQISSQATITFNHFTDSVAWKVNAKLCFSLWIRILLFIISKWNASICQWLQHRVWSRVRFWWISNSQFLQQISKQWTLRLH